MRLAVILLVSACYEPPMFEVEVAWNTAGAEHADDEHLVGAELDYLRGQYHGPSYRVSEWNAGYAGEELIVVDSTESPRTICLTLVRHDPIDHGHWGCSDCPEFDVTPISVAECKDVVLDVEPARVAFAVILAP